MNTRNEKCTICGMVEGHSNHVPLNRGNGRVLPEHFFRPKPSAADQPLSEEQKALLLESLDILTELVRRSRIDSSNVSLSCGTDESDDGKGMKRLSPNKKRFIDVRIALEKS